MRRVSWPLRLLAEIARGLTSCSSYPGKMFRIPSTLKTSAHADWQVPSPRWSTSVLRQDCADNHSKGSFHWPPVLLPPMHPTVCNKFRRPLPREPHACGYALCALVASLLRLLALLKLLFPTQDASLVGLGFRLRNHTLALIQNRQAGVREHVVRI